VEEEEMESVMEVEVEDRSGRRAGGGRREGGRRRSGGGGGEDSGRLKNEGKREDRGRSWTERFSSA